MGEYLKVDTATAIGSMIAVLSTIIGLVVWLVKQQTRRQEKVTDRYFAHLEENAKKNERVHELYAASFAKVGESISLQTVEISRQTAQLGELTGKVGSLAENVALNTCQAAHVKPAATGRRAR